MNEVQSAEKIKALTAPILEKGFTFEYTYQKGGDSSCVYIYRFQKGRDYLDWREVSGGDEINIVVFIKGEYFFPSLKRLFPERHKAFRRKHFFRRASVDEKRTFVAECLLEELSLDKPDFFGVKL